MRVAHDERLPTPETDDLTPDTWELRPETLP